MLLESIAGPADLRQLGPAELAQLSAEIRDAIVTAVAANGGHLGSNLGAVELTLAVHRVFESPRDVVLWDTGHQAYTHKMVTGRWRGFDRLRKEGGLSGYPSRTESEHDWVENSHASTILSYAHGWACAVERSGDHRHVVAVIGDGSLTGGMAYEALNNLGHSGKRAIIVVNDNGRSYAPTVSRLTDTVHRMRNSPAYVRRRDQVEQLLHHLPLVGERLEKAVDGARAALREVFEATAFYEELGVRYTGPVDGHDIAALETALNDAAAHDGPVVVHVLTQKGRGYAPAELDEEKHWHDAPIFDPEKGPQPSAPGGYTGVFSQALVRAAARDERITAITAAMPGSTGLLPFQQRFPDRFLDVGIAEQHAVTAAAGMAMGGLRPVVAVYSTFLTRAFDQINLDVGLHRLPVVFVIDRAGITGDDGPSHHGVLDLALLSKVPGMTVLAPSSDAELEAMFDQALHLDSGPVAIRFPKGAMREVAVDDVGEGLRGRRLVAGDGSVCILAVGKMVAAALAAADQLRSAGIGAEVWDVRVVAPLDPAMIEAAAAHDWVITVEDGIRAGGAGSAILDELAALTREQRRPMPATAVLGTPVDYLPHAKPAAIHQRLGLDAEGIAGTVTRVLATGSTQPIAGR